MRQLEVTALSTSMRAARRAGMTAAAIPASAAALLDHITEREREVLGLVAKGQSNAGDCGAALRQPPDREDTRQPPVDEARRPRPCPTGDDRLRNRRRIRRHC